MDHGRLSYLEEHRALICLLCEHAVGSDVGRHLRRHHNMVIPLDKRKSLIESTRGLKIQDPNSIPIPKRMGVPIEGLKIQRGWECVACSFACISDKYMEIHCRKQHGWTKNKEALVAWNMVWVQTFAPKNHGQYFVIDMDETDSTTTQEVMKGKEGIQRLGDSGKADIERILKEAEEREADEKRVLGTNQRAMASAIDRTPWLARTGWLDTFAGKDIGKMYKMTELPKVSKAKKVGETGIDDEKRLLAIMASVDRTL
jgi:Orsellinic acid/F9775 biosynthesis cluster protein D